jgi:hypothetical protein
MVAAGVGSGAEGVLLAPGCGGPPRRFNSDIVFSYELQLRKLHEVSFAGSINQLPGHSGISVTIFCLIQNLITEITRMTGA